MISWQVQIDGRNPTGWDMSSDGCWFPDFDHQEYLLPHFDVGDVPIDEYDRTEFREADLRRLREHLRHYQGYVEAKPETWSVTEAAGEQSKTIRLERETIMKVIDKTLEMIEIALAGGGTLVFLGD
jgi:hypothetical protein